MNILNSVTLIIPLFNKEHEIGRCLESLLGQSICPITILVVDNNSTDSSVGVVKSFVDKFNDNGIKLNIINCERQGAGCARNLGVCEAKTELVSFLDADDFLLPNYFSALEVLMTSYDANVFCLGYEIMKNRKHGRGTRNIASKSRIIIGHSAFCRTYFFNRGFMCSSNVTLHKSVFDKYQFENSSFEEDMFLWANIGWSELIAFDPKTYILIDSDPVSGNSSSRNGAVISRIHLSKFSKGLWGRLIVLRRFLALYGLGVVRKLNLGQYPLFMVMVFSELFRVFLLRVFR